MVWQLYQTLDFLSHMSGLQYLADFFVSFFFKGNVIIDFTIFYMKSDTASLTFALTIINGNRFVGLVILLYSMHHDKCKSFDIRQIYLHCLGQL